MAVRQQTADARTTDGNGRMLRIAPLIAAAAMFALSAQADETTGSRVQAGLKEFSARLALTSEQETQVRSIFVEHLEVQTATLERYDVDVGDRDSAHTVDLQKMRALLEELRANRARIESRLSGVLSETQMAEFRRIRTEQEEKLRERMVSRRLDEIGVKLELTPEQTERVRPILKEHFDAQMAVLDRHGVAPGNRDGERPGLRTLRRLRKDLGANNERTVERLSAILSRAQLETYEALQAEQRRRLRALLFDG